MNRYLYAEHHEAILSDELFEAVQEEKMRRAKLQERYFTDLINRNPEWENAGVFAERASGLHAKQRSEFARLMRLCRHGHVDLILTKSISRFEKNTLDMLRVLQKLNAWGVDVYFELENL